MDCKKVCVIGAGPSGLSAIRHIRTSPKLEGICFEQNDAIGGIWLYREETDIHSAMYRDLRTNLTTQTMTFSRDFPFEGDGTESFVSHSKVFQYLKEFTDHYQLWDSIKLNVRVTNVSRIDRPGVPTEPQWRVTTFNLLSQETDRFIFDSVIVCNGHHFKPAIPEIANLDQFKGRVIHSINYRSREIFKNLRVVVFGCGPSGTDITLEIATVAKEVIMTIRKPPIACEMPSNVRQVLPIKMATQNGFIFNDGSECQADFLVLCTGYSYYFPFLDETCEVVMANQGREVTPLYRHMIHTKYPTLCFLGLPFIALIFYMIDLQSRFYVKYLEGVVRLPGEEEMNKELEEDRLLRDAKGLTIKQRHLLGQFQKDYYTDLAVRAGCPEELRPVLYKIYDATYDRRMNFASMYKDDLLRIIEPDHFVYDRCDGQSEKIGQII